MNTAISNTERLSQAIAYRESGLSLVPIAAKSKAPPINWKPYQTRKPTDAELEKWVSKYSGLGIVGGKVSGRDGAGLEILDIEAIGLIEEFRALVEEAAPGLLKRLPRDKTPTGGRHIFYRCEVVDGNQKLAQRAEEVAGDELPRTDDGALDLEAIKKDGVREINGKYFKIRTLIETRAAGGQVLSPLCLPGTHPSGGEYEMINGDLCAIPTITARERDILLTAARACNEFVEPSKTRGSREAKQGTGQGLKPGEDYNSRSDAFEKTLDMLKGHGWTVWRDQSIGPLLSRPGVSGHASARLFDSGALHVFTSNASRFDVNQSYSPFAVYTELEHNGDYSAAALALSKQGYGDQAKSSKKKQDQKGKKVETGEEERDEVDEPRMSKAAMVVDLAADAELFHNAEGRTYARVAVNGHIETWPLRSSSFKRWLGACFWQEHKATIHPPAIAEALQTLDGRAMYEGEEREVHIRIAEHDGNIYLDLCDATWRAVEITADGWRVISAKDCPVRFRRAGGMLSLPEPKSGGAIGDLRGLMNLADDSQWTLTLSWLIAAIRPGAPFPVLGVHGEHGSAKSSTQKILRQLVDPNTAPLRSMPRDERDLAIMASNSHIVALDNLSRLSESMSDALCRLATGGGLSTRELYSNDDEMTFDLRKPVMISGITEIATKSDLLDRSILIYLPLKAKVGGRVVTVTELHWSGRYYATDGAGLVPLHIVPIVEEAQEMRRAQARWAVSAPDPVKVWKRQGCFRSEPLTSYERTVKAERARTWLRKTLTGPMPAKAVFELARKAGIPARGLKRAKRRLGVKSLKVGGKHRGWGAVWMWALDRS
jgi:hypothetical protein